MKKYLCACLFVLTFVAVAQADDATLKDARQSWLAGRYAAARTAYENLAKDAKEAKYQAAAAIGVSQTWRSEGEYDKALEAIDAALKNQAKSANLHARRAELLYLRGRGEDAEKAAEAALALDKEHFLARWVRAQVYWDRGDLKNADSEFRWFVRTYTERSNNDNDIKDPDALLLVGLAGTINARWYGLSDQFDFILNELYKDALKLDKNLWQAEYQAGMLLLEKYNRGEALEAFDNALKINPNAAEAYVGKGLAALQKLEFKDAEMFAERALKINPNLPEALRLRADVHLAAGDLASTLKELETARKVNARDESTLGQVAACLYLQRKPEEFDALAKEVEKRNPKAGVFYHELAERLEARRHFDAAEKYYKKSAELRPMLPWARNSLGLLYMRLGREKEAREILDEAFKADKYNVRVSNTLKVLRHLEKYETLKTEHFELRFDPKSDRALARFMAEYLETVYADLAEKFQYRPKGPILFEVFNNHEMFSGRVVALPDLHTIGACTGRMVAMVTPNEMKNGKPVRKPFNWGRVVRHELVHIFNLEQTNFLVPHWLTEGLAVSNEGFPRPQPWNHLLLDRVPKGKGLLNLDTIDLAFMRPRDPLEWHLAYCQSQLYVDYMKEKYGPQTVSELLAAYRDGLNTAEAIAKVCKVDKATFEQGYRTYLEGIVKGLKGKPPEKTLTFTQLKEEYEKDPDNADVAARLAEQYLRRNDRVQARKLAEAVLSKKKSHPMASYVKARLLLQAGDAEGARTLLEAAVDNNNPDPKVLLEVGKMHYEASDFAKAAEVFELGRKVEPYDNQWLQQLARVYAQTGDKEKQISVLKDLVPTDADDLEHRKRLAKLLLDAGRHAEAERYARQALEIDVRDAEVMETLQKALIAQKKDAEAERLRKLLEK